MAASLNNKPRLIKFWLPGVICMAFIFYTSSIPGSNIPPLFFFQDVIFHLLVYSALALSVSRALKNTYINISSCRALIFTIIFSLFYALTDELHQGFVPYRTPSGLDIFVDTLGATLGSLVYAARKYFAHQTPLSDHV